MLNSVKLVTISQHFRRILAVIYLWIAESVPREQFIVPFLCYTAGDTR